MLNSTLGCRHPSVATAASRYHHAVLLPPNKRNCLATDSIKPDRPLFPPNDRQLRATKPDLPASEMISCVLPISLCYSVRKLLQTVTMSCYPAAQAFARASAARRTGIDNPCNAYPDAEELEGTTAVCANQEHPTGPYSPPSPRISQCGRTESKRGQKHATNAYLQPLPPLSR